MIACLFSMLLRRGSSHCLAVAASLFGALVTGERWQVLPRVATEAGFSPYRKTAATAENAMCNKSLLAVTAPGQSFFWTPFSLLAGE